METNSEYLIFLLTQGEPDNLSLPTQKKKINFEDYDQTFSFGEVYLTKK